MTNAENVMFRKFKNGTYFHHYYSLKKMIDGEVLHYIYNDMNVVKHKTKFNNKTTKLEYGMTLLNIAKNNYNDVLW